MVGEDVKQFRNSGATAVGPRPDLVALTRRRRRRLARWHSIVISLVAAIGIASLPAMAGSDAARAAIIDIGGGKQTVQVRVSTGKSENVHTEIGFVDVVVGDPEIADVVPLTDHSLSILGKKIGTTRVSVYADGKRLAGVFDIEVSYDTVQLSAELARRFPLAQIKVSTVNGRIMLSGNALDAVTVDKAVTIARQFGHEVINSISVLQSQQVLLEVRFVEISRTAARELGIQWNVVGQNINATIGTASLLSGSTPFGSVMANLLRSGTKVDAVIQALEERDVARRLAEPNLVALSGDTASFLAGGEFPFPVAAQLGQITVDWKRFGVGLAFTPTVLGNGLINLKIEPEVSQLDPSNVIQIGGLSVPSLIVRRRASRWRACCRTSARPTSSNFRGLATSRSLVRCSVARNTRRRKPISPSS